MPPAEGPVHSPESAKRVRVLLVGPSMAILGGQAIQAQRLLEHLRRSPFLHAEFLAVDPRCAGAIGRLQEIKYVRTVVTSAIYGWRLLRAVPQFDVIHAFSASYFSYLLAPLPAMLAARIFGKRTVLNYRSGQAESHLREWRRSAVPTMRRLADCIVTPSEYLVEVFARHGLSARSIANFVALDDLPFRQRARPRPVFFCNRNLEPLYNVGCILRAFAVIQRACAEATLVIAGDGTERSALEALAGKLALRNVTFVGRVAPSDMPGYLDAADIYLNSPNIDNMPGSILEAFACGLPVVTTNAGGIPWIVTHDENGLMVPAGDADAMAAQALRLLDEAHLAERLSNTARRQCEQRYVWPAVLGQWEATYLELSRRGSPVDDRSGISPERASA